ncbi:MAG TPA: hypothetical protein VGV64_02655 [Thermoplasmata archaeon]|nr:hypothetical protein [Thermoplasmata archaeon]
MTYTTLKLCSGRAAYEAFPHPRRSIDLGKVRARIEREGIEVTDARVMLIARHEPEVTIGRDGRLLVKTPDPVLAQRVFERFLRLVES